MIVKRDFESPFLYGIHDPGGEHLMLEMDTPGWVLVTEAIGYNPENKRGRDYTHLTQQGLAVMVRLNAGYGGVGTLPAEQHYEAFAQRCANFVEASAGAHIWIIGNEPNHPIEWPGADWDWNTAQPVSPDTVGEKITPERYAKAYLLVREAIRNVPGHEEDMVLTAAIAPWNALCTYPGNPNGDWILYFRHMLTWIGAGNCDGITLHAYTHGSDPNLIDANTRMQPPFQWRRFEFRVYQDFMAAIPWNMQHLPVYLTEADQNDPWLNENNGWVKRAFGEIDHWNKRHPFRPIRALILYRWSKSDQWYIDGKAGVIEDFRESMRFRYRWDQYQEKAPPYRAQIVVLEAPDYGTVGETLTITVAMRNLGSKTWKRGVKNPFHVGYHWKDADGEIVLAPDFRTTLPQHVPPGEWVEVDVAVGLPSIPGSFFLYIDMVHEGVTWFEEQGSTPARIPIQVRLTGQGEVTNTLWRYIQHLKAENQALKRRFLGWTDLFTSATSNEIATSTGLEPSLNGDFLALDSELRIPKPPMIDIVEALPTRSDETYEERDINDITHIAIHHSATPADVPPERIAAYHVYSQTHQWPGMGYHFYIDPEGTIYYTQALNRISWHVHNNNSYTVGVCLAGNFNLTIPPTPQLEATAWLVAWLMQELRIPPEQVLGHKEFPMNATACPGYQWDAERRWKDGLMKAIEAIRTGERQVEGKVLPHYVLFWKHETAWAQKDWEAAGAFVSKFNAVAGFSAEEARLAELVTIVGAPAGIGLDVEAELRASGCIVQRIAGETPEETAAMLASLANANSPLLRKS